MPSNDSPDQKKEMEELKSTVEISQQKHIGHNDNSNVDLEAPPPIISPVPPQKGEVVVKDNDDIITKTETAAISSGMDGVPGAHPSTAGRHGASILNYVLDGSDKKNGGGTTTPNEGEDGRGDRVSSVGKIASPRPPGEGDDVEQTVLRRASDGRRIAPAAPGAFAHGGVQQLVVEDERQQQPSGQQQPGQIESQLLGGRTASAGHYYSSDDEEEGGGDDDDNHNGGEGLVQADPVEEETERQLQEAQELDDTNQQKTSDQVQQEHQKVQRLYFLCLVGLIMLAVAIVVPVVVSSNNSKKKDGETQTATVSEDISNVITPLPTSGAPSSAPTGVLDELFLNLPPYTLESLEKFGTPQNLAWTWLNNHQNVTNMSLWKQRELFALATFFYSYEGPNWFGPIQERWMDDTKDSCYWYSSGFGWFDEDNSYNPWEDQYRTPSCTEDGHFTRLWLGDLGLEGLSPSLPPELALLTNLTHIDLSSGGLNNMTISDLVPMNFFEEMTHLENLVLYFNQISGTIPTQFGLLSNVAALQLNGNSLTGTIPTQIGTMGKNLVNLGVWGNQLTGTLPTQLGLLSNHQYLELGGGNSFTGTIPSQIGLISSMLYLDFSSNPSLTGTFPQELSVMESLGILDLTGSTGLSGTLPEEICYLADPNCTFTLWFGRDDPCYFGFNCTEHDLLCGCDCPCSE